MKYTPYLFFFLLMVACNRSDGVTKSNYSYKFHVDKEGESPKVGDLVVFHEKVFLNKKEVFSTEESGQKEIVLPTEESLTRPLPPNYEILFHMSPGDSVTVTQKLEDVENLPEGYESDDVLKYVIKLIEVTPKIERPPLKKKGRTAANYPYQFIVQTGNIAAQPGDRVRFREHYYINDSIVFSTPIEQPKQAFLPARHKVPNPPPGNYEALLLAGIGDSLHLDQLLEDAPNLPNHISKNDTFKYRIQVLDVLTPAEYWIFKKTQDAQAAYDKEATKKRKDAVKKMTLSNIEKYKNGEFEEELIYTQSNLKYIIHEKGTGKIPNPKQNLKVHYYGFLENGESFDNSFESGDPYEFPLGMRRVIAGWDQGFSKIPVGTKATFFVPYRLAYGIAGRPPTIPRKSNLVFYVELLSAE